MSERIWEPNSKPQRIALERSEREILYGGARGGGKSEAGIVWLGEPEYIRHPAYSSLVVRKNSKDLKAWLYRFKNFYGDAVDVSQNLISWHDGGHTYVGHLKDERSLEALLGNEFQKILIEELTQVKSEDFYLQLLGSLRSTIGLPAQCFSTTNPGGVGHAWVKRRFIDVANMRVYKDSRGLTRIYIPAKVYDNVDLVKKDPAYISYLETLPDKLKEAWLNGNWEIFSGQFFSEFGPHLREEPFYIPPHQANLIGSLDYGEADDATSFGLWHVDYKKIAHRLFTYYKKGLNTSAYARGIKDAILSFPYTQGVMPKNIIADPSMFVRRKIEEHAVSPADIFAQHDLKLTPANNERINGWRVMREYYSKDALTGDCKHFYFNGFNDEYEEFIPTLIHNERRPEDVLKGGEDHIGDETRYFFVYAMVMGSNQLSGRNKKLADRAKINEINSYAAKMNTSITGY